MTSQGNGQSIPYQVILPQQGREAILRAHQRALQAGKGQKFLDTLRVIHGRLCRDPDVFGEALFHLPSLKLVVRQAVVAGVVVDFAVHLERPLVFIQDVKLLG